MFHDAKRFILKNRSIIDMAPLQVYHSALVFRPEKSVISLQFSGQAPRWIKSLTIVEKDWDSSLQVLEGHSGPVNALVFSPHGRLLVSGHDNGAIKLWDPTTGVRRGTLEGHSKSVKILAFSPEGDIFASGSDDCTVRLWEPIAGTQRSILKGHSDRVRAIAFSPDASILASGSKDRTVRLWDISTGTSRSVIEGH